MNDTAIQFSRMPGNLSLRGVVKAKDKPEPPETILRRHLLGVVREAAKMFPKDVLDIAREEAAGVVK